MSDEPKRWKHTFVPGFPGPTCMVEATDGGYVEYDDYAALRAELDAKNEEIERLRTRCCAICNDTRKLSDSQAWDCGQEDSECPYCPDVVDRLRADLAAANEAIRLANPVMEIRSQGDGFEWATNAAVRAAMKEGK